jgi:putative restriction endonuclease
MSAATDTVRAQRVAFHLASQSSGRRPWPVHAGADASRRRLFVAQQGDASSCGATPPAQLRPSLLTMNVPYPTREPFVAVTDPRWFDFLSRRRPDRRLDEVNFWSPQATRPIKRFVPGEPVFFRLKRPHAHIAGYGFFAAWHLVDLDTCWELFGPKNGDPSEEAFLTRIGEYRGADLRDPSAHRAPIGCTVLREAVFWPESRWIPWGEARGWPANAVRGKTEHDERNVQTLMSAMVSDAARPPAEFAPAFEPVDVDARRLAAAERVEREGQGAFRLRLLDAYGRQCAITGEHTEPVLDAAHIQPYLGPRSNHLQNGLVLTKEFHALFDRGYVTVTPDLVVRVSPRLHDDWRNGRRYYAYDGKRLVAVPAREDQRPSGAALQLHNERVFLRSA